MRLYVGTYTRNGSRGIYQAALDPRSGALTVHGVAAETQNPSFLVMGRGGAHLYAVNEVGDFGGEASGAVTAFAVDRDSGALRRLNQRSSRGGAPCHLAVDRGGRFLLVANYSGGNAAVLPIAEDGSLGEAVSVVQHRGSGPNRERQGEPHVHSVTLDRANRLALVADLGIDRLMAYRFDDRTGSLAPADPAWTALRPGAGPRHFAFHPDGRRAYVINELDSTLTALSYDPASGALTPGQTVPTLPADFTGRSHCADVHVHRSGRFVYGSNRGHDSIVVFAIDPASGKLTAVDHTSTQGKMPRNFALDPSGKYLLAANQGSDNIVAFRIDPATGKLTPTGSSVAVGAPVCVTFVP